jgi:hypothetical protein
MNWPSPLSVKWPVWMPLFGLWIIVSGVGEGFSSREKQPQSAERNDMAE